MSCPSPCMECVGSLVYLINVDCFTLLFQYSGRQDPHTVVHCILVDVQFLTILFI